MVKGAVLTLISLVAFDGLALERRPCPEGKVWGGNDCVWKELCKDGRPYVNGRCIGDTTKQSPQPQPTPPVPAPPTPINIQVPTPPTGGMPCVPMPAGRPCRHPAFAICSGEATFLYSASSRKTVSARRLLIAGGNAGDLIEEYFSDARRESKNVDPELLTVLYFDGKSATPRIVRGDVDVKMGILDFLTRTSMEGVWVEYLASTTVPTLHCGIETAQCLNADYICNRHP